MCFVRTTVNSSLNSSVLNYYFFFSQKRKGKQNSSMVYIDSYVSVFTGEKISAGVTRYLHRYLQILQKSADICRYCKYLQISADFNEGKCV